MASGYGDRVDSVAAGLRNQSVREQSRCEFSEDEMLVGAARNGTERHSVVSMNATFAWSMDCCWRIVLFCANTLLGRIYASIARLSSRSVILR